MDILSISTYEQKVEALEKDRADFEAELDRAEKRIQELEEALGWGHRAMEILRDDTSFNLPDIDKHIAEAARLLDK